MTLGILAAIHDEVDGLIAALHANPSADVRTIGRRDYHVGELFGQRCVLVLARMGKVAAAATTVTLIREFGVDDIVFTGLAGGVDPATRVGDVVIGERTLQHDLDERPLHAANDHVVNGGWFLSVEVPEVSIQRPAYDARDFILVDHAASSSSP